MKNATFAIFLSLCFLGLLNGQTYITDVTIIDVEQQQLIEHQTVVIVDELISDIQHSKDVSIPSNTKVLDGKGNYLMPGLVDAHIHFFQNGGLYSRPDVIDLTDDQPYTDEITLAKKDMENKLHRYVHNGITTVIDVGANEYFLNRRTEYAEDPYAPQIYMTGPLLTTYKPPVYDGLGDFDPFYLTSSIEDGIQAVQAQLPLDPDFIKIWYITGADGLSVDVSARKNLPIVKAIIDEAHKHNLKVAVHATQKVTAQLAVENGADFLVHSVDDQIVDQGFVKLLKAKGTVLCPTLIVHGGYINTFSHDLKLTHHDLYTGDPFQIGTLMDLQHLSDTTLVKRYHLYASSPMAQEDLRKKDSISMANLKILSDAGVTIATGTDAGNIGTLHASSYLSELQAMKTSGMSNWDIITASTINGAKVLDKDNQEGSIAIGKKANLVLLDDNPIDDLTHTSSVRFIINKGQILTPNEVVKDTPADLAQRQLNAYNLRDIEAFLEPYADDVEVYTFPDQLNYKGKEAMRERYSQMFETVTNLHCELMQRIVQRNKVIDKEHVRFGDQYVEATAMYHIEDGKISKVYFVR